MPSKARIRQWSVKRTPKMGLTSKKQRPIKMKQQGGQVFSAPHPHGPRSVAGHMTAYITRQPFFGATLSKGKTKWTTDW